MSKDLLMELPRDNVRSGWVLGKGGNSGLWFSEDMLKRGFSKGVAKLV